MPVDARSKTDYFDSLYHASAAVGLNTSAMIEAAILGHPVHTILLPEFHDSQEGTVHFHYLLDGPDGAAARQRDRSTSMRASSPRLLDGRDPDPDRSARFVRAFVRPAASSTAATTRFVEALEALAARPAPAPLPVPVWTHLIRPLLQPFADRGGGAGAPHGGGIAPAQRAAARGAPPAQGAAARGHRQRKRERRRRKRERGAAAAAHEDAS